MPLSWNEIRSRAHTFSHKWVGEESERAEAQSFRNDFFAVFGIERRRVAIFEKQVDIARAGEKLKHGRIDAFAERVAFLFERYQALTSLLPPTTAKKRLGKAKALSAKGSSAP
jgi:hypothetical protein